MLFSVTVVMGLDLAALSLVDLASKNDSLISMYVLSFNCIFVFRIQTTTKKTLVQTLRENELRKPNTNNVVNPRHRFV